MQTRGMGLFEAPCHKSVWIGWLKHPLSNRGEGPTRRGFLVLNGQDRVFQPPSNPKTASRWMNNDGNDSDSSTGSSSESGTSPINRLVNYRVIPPARTMNVHRPVSQTAAKKNIASAVYYSWGSLSWFNKSLYTPTSVSSLLRSVLSGKSWHLPFASLL